MVRLRVFFGAMMGTGLMGLGIGIELGQHSHPSEPAKAVALPSPACSVESPVLLGYCTVQPQPSECRTVRVLSFKNALDEIGNKFAARLGGELTEAVTKAIESKTPYRVVTGGDADMELTGTLLRFDRKVMSYNQLNEMREVETFFQVEVTWHDFRTGRNLLAQDNKSHPGSVKLAAVSSYRPEIGESIQVAHRNAAESLAMQILTRLETPQ